MGDSGNMRISLPPETILKGQKEAYKVDNIICLSERSQFPARIEREENFGLNFITETHL